MQTQVIYKNEHEKPSLFVQNLLLNKLKLNLSLGEWKNKKMDQICQLIDVWYIEHFWISSNHLKTIPISLFEIKFLKLISLDLANNKLASIQPLIQISMPALRKLLLNQNQLHSINIIYKMNAPLLRNLALNGNAINDG